MLRKLVTTNMSRNVVEIDSKLLATVFSTSAMDNATNNNAPEIAVESKISKDINLLLLMFRKMCFKSIDMPSPKQIEGKIKRISVRICLTHKPLPYMPEFKCSRLNSSSGISDN